MPFLLRTSLWQKNICTTTSPASPTMPASLMIEAMAQTGGILVGYERKFKEKVILAKINKATFHDIVRPGDQLILEAVIDNFADEAASITGTIKCGEKSIADIKMMFSHIDNNIAGMEFPEDNFVFNDQFMGLLRFYLPEGTMDNIS